MIPVHVFGDDWDASAVEPQPSAWRRGYDIGITDGIAAGYRRGLYRGAALAVASALVGSAVAASAFVLIVGGF